MTLRTLGGRYRLDAQIGRGGMATVYRAWDSRLERDVAVKVLASDLKDDPAYVARFVQEAKLSAKLRHPNLVEVFDVALSDENELYLVMELLDGKSLGSLIGENGLALPEFFRIAREIASGLRVLHAANVVHRDLSANNVMLVRHGDRDDHVKVLDLGIAKAQGQKTLTEPGSFIGTLESMPPEQIRGEPLDARADVYALGILFYRMLAGAPPFAGTAATLMYHHLEVTPAPVESHGTRRLPTALSQLVARCLEKDGARRPADAAELFDELVFAEKAPSGAGAVTGDRASHDAEVPDLPLRPTPARDSRSLSEGRASGPLPAAPHATGSRREAVLEPDEDDALALPLELAPVVRKSSSVVAAAEACPGCGSPVPPAALACATCGQRPHGSITPFRAPEREGRAKLPGWLAPLGVLPVTVGKRVSGYSFLAAILSIVFFRGAVAISLLGVGLLAAAGVYVRTRNDEDP